MYKSAILVILLMCINSCSAPIRSITQQQLIAGQGEFALKYQSDLKIMANKSQARLAGEYKHADYQSYDILVLSGGGPLGAFGAGYLKGWGKVTEQEFVRPDFDSVSGISTGALIAPFAFVGTDDSYNQIVNLYRNPDRDMVVARSLLSFLSGYDSYYDAKVLHQRIRSSFTPDIIKSIAEKGRQNNTLLVGATNLDYGVMRVWDLSEIADSYSVEAAQEQITTKLIASSAIPSAFPPVNIDDNLYVDGGASMQVVSGIDDRSWLYEDRKSDTHFVDPSKPLRLRIWVIVNNKLVMDPEVVSPRWSSIATRSLVSLMRGSTLQTLQDIETFSNMINKRNDFDVQMRFVSIPQSYKIPKSDNLFDSKIMKGLVDLGEQMGANANSWKTKALRPGASILDSR
jgi:predicted acylesterase/phospholipase RssA